MTLHLRSAHPGEGALILGFVRELAEYEHLAHEIDANAAMIEAALFGPHPGAFCEIAEWDGEPVGYALWFLNFSTFRGRHGVYLEDIFVRPGARGRGIGRALLARLARKCVDNGWTRFEWSVLDWNAPSIAFYKAQGATIESQWQICRVTGEALARLAEGP